MSFGYDIGKRGLDVVVSAAAIAAAWPIMASIGAAIVASMGRPVLFRQTRPGRDGDPFELYKFRTMRNPKPGEEMLATDARRITRLGTLLRRTSLDELPTLFNVLKGDMTLVGPRPLLMRYLNRYTPRQARRHEVKPGVTGWAQVNGRNALSWDEKFDLDVWYVDNRSMRLDIEILIRTLLVVLRREGIAAEGTVTMPEFMGSSLSAEAA